MCSDNQTCIQRYDFIKQLDTKMTYELGRKSEELKHRAVSWKEDSTEDVGLAAPSRKKQKKRKVVSLEELRQATAKKLQYNCRDMIDIPYQIKTIGGIFAINKEIWARCSSNRIFKERHDNEIGKMIRRGFFKVFADGTKMKIKYEEEHKTFEDIPQIPDELTKIIPLCGTSISRYSFLPDYNEYLNRVFLLHDDVLGRFLVRLKDHFEEMQVFLGEIEKWMNTPQTCLSFLRSIFSVKETFIEQTLLEWDSGNYKQTFDITKDDEKEKLKLFIDFVKKYPLQSSKLSRKKTLKVKKKTQRF